MATVSFLGVGTPAEAYNIDNTLVLKPRLPGELRMRSSFVQPGLEMWRRAALQNCSRTPTTGSSDIATRARMVLLFANEADLSAIFTNLKLSTAADRAGYYVDKRKAIEADAALKQTYVQKKVVMKELTAIGVPAQYTDLLLTRLDSPSFNHRVSAVCAAVYLASVILTEPAE